MCFLVFLMCALFRFNLCTVSFLPKLRLLDNDLAAVMKAAEDFDWNRIAFVLEAPSYHFF